MTINVDALNPCLAFKDNIEKGLDSLNAMRYQMGPLKTALNDITNAGGSIDDDSIGDVVSNLSIGLNNTVNSMDTLTAQIEGLTGLCLTAVTGPLNTLAQNSAGMTSGLMDSVSSSDATSLGGLFGTVTQEFFDTALGPTTTILNRVASMDSLVNELGIVGVLAGLDEVLGCAAEGSDCGDLISPEVIDGYFLEISDFVDEFALTDTGGIDMSYILDVAGISSTAATAIDSAGTVLQSATDAIGIKANSQIYKTSVKLIDFKLY